MPYHRDQKRNKGKDRKAAWRQNQGDNSGKSMKYKFRVELIANMRRPVYNTCSCPPVDSEDPADSHLNRDMPAAMASQTGKADKL